MIGCVLLGAAGLFAVAKLAHWRHHGHGYGGGCGHGWHGRHHGWHHGFDDGPDGPGPWAGGGGGSRWVLARLIDGLDATPEQARVIRDAADELRDAASKLRGEGRKTRAEVADALRKPHFDEVLFGELFARHDTALESLRKAFVGAGARIHDALDERQRARLADLVESGPRGWRRARRGWGGGGGGAWDARGW